MNFAFQLVVGSFFSTPTALFFLLFLFFALLWGAGVYLECIKHTLLFFSPTLLPRKLKNSVAVESTLNACHAISLICVRQSVLKFVIAKSTSVGER